MPEALTSKESMYTKISNEEINEIAESDPQRALLALLANSAISDAKEKSAGKPHEPDKSLEQNSVGQIVAYQTCSRSRLWAKYYSKPCQSGGRIWVDHAMEHSHGHHFDAISKDTLTSVYYGHNQSNSISTFPYSFWNKYAPDGPTTEEKEIQSYRNAFIKLACKIAERLGGIIAVNINYGDVLVPEQLESLGYSVTYLKGQAGKYNGYGEDLVLAKKDGETVMLRSGNSMVPWATIRRVEKPNMAAEDLTKELTF